MPLVDSRTLRGVAAAAALVCASAVAADAPRACKDISVSVTGRAESDALYVDRPYLRILVQPRDESYGLREMVGFMLTNRFAALETRNILPTGDLLPYSMKPPADGRPGFMRVSVKPLGHPACEAYERAKRYPAQAWPWLRSLGLQVNECIGVERIAEAERAALRILVHEEELRKRPAGDWELARLNVRVVDASTNPERVLARMTELYERRGGGKAGIFHVFPCAQGDRQTKVLAQAFAATGKRHGPPRIVELDPATPAPTQASDDELRRLDWISRPGKAWSGNVANPEGTVWVSWGGVGPHHRFHVFLGERIVSTRVAYPSEMGTADLTGLASTAGGWAVVAGTNLRAPGAKPYLVEFNAGGELVRVVALTASQYAMLAGGSSR